MPETGTTSFAARDGRVLSYRSVGSGPPLVMVPGGPGLDPSAYFALVRVPGRRQVLLTPRGSGTTGPPLDPATHRFATHVDDLEDLRSHLGVERMGLYGGGLGVTVALAYAQDHPHRVDRLVLVNGPACFDRSYQAQLAAAQRRFADTAPLGVLRLARAAAAEECLDNAGDADTRRVAHAMLFDAHVAQPSRTTQAFLADLARAPAALLATRAAYDALVGGLDLLPGCGRVTAPTLVVAGDLDATSSAAHLQVVAAALTNGTFVSIPRVGHFPELEDHETWRRHVLGFLVDARVRARDLTTAGSRP